VTSPDYPDIGSVTFVPEKPDISEVHVTGDTISFHIIDDPSEEEYYFVTVYGWKEEYHYEQLDRENYTH